MSTSPTDTVPPPATTSHSTPAQHRVWTDLLGAGDRRSDRPRTDPGLGQALRSRVLAGLKPSLDEVPSGTRIWLNKTALSALSCDGRFLDHQRTPFNWSPSAVAGQLAHSAIAVDLAGQRTRSVEQLVDFAWRSLAAGGSSAGVYLERLDGPDADAVRAATAARCMAFRESFPALPAWMHPRTEVAFTWRLSGGVVIKGVPDLVIGRPDANRRLMQLIDLKTGARRDSHRHELRLYGLLATVKYGIAPFRLTTYYLDEADWDAEDVTGELLAETADMLVRDVSHAIRLTVTPPESSELSLRAGPACNWCSMAPKCPMSRRGQPAVRLVAA